MNYTENYHLPQWVETDRVQMEDFNAAMASIDSIFVTGSYSGNLESKTIDIGFRPRFLVIMAPTKSSYESPMTHFFAGGETNAFKDRLKFLDTGFQVTFVQGSTPILNSNQYQFFYFAFR